VCSPSGAATTASGNRPAGCWNWARRSRGPRRDRRAHPGRAAHRDLQYKHMKIGVVALVFRCIPTGGAPRATDESHEAQWLPVPVALRSMPPTFAVRVEDALLPTARARTHDGVIQYFYNKRLLPRRPLRRSSTRCARPRPRHYNRGLIRGQAHGRSALMLCRPGPDNAPLTQTSPEGTGRPHRGPPWPSCRC